MTDCELCGYPAGQECEGVHFTCLLCQRTMPAGLGRTVGEHRWPSWRCADEIACAREYMRPRTGDDPPDWHDDGDEDLERFADLEMKSDEQ